MRDNGNAIEVTDVKKAFKVYYDRGITMKDKILSRGRSRYELREVLKGISFDVKKGEAIGLIGKNGCGKSTTLKLLTKIIYPNSGRVEMNGRVSSLLELGAGFHPDMSGMENIYMNAAVFGLNRKEIDKRVKDIIQFSELEEFIDNPVRTYSSGMYMRLAFSVAINVDADILLIDEILAVGDISFQKKCFEKLQEIKMRGTTIVIVSHSLDQIEKICDRSVWIEDGKIKAIGKPREIHEEYLYKMEQERLARFQQEYYENMDMQDGVSGVEDDKADDGAVEGMPDGGGAESETGKETAGGADKAADGSNLEKGADEEPEEGEQTTDGAAESEPSIEEQMRPLKRNFLNDKRIRHTGNQRVRFTEMYVTDAAGEEKIQFETGEDVIVFLKYKAQQDRLKGTLCLLIYSDDGTYCHGTNTFIEDREVKEMGLEGYLKIKTTDIPLLPGKYYFTIAIHDEQAVEYEHVEHAAVMQIYFNKGEQGITRMQTEWTLQ